MEQKRNTLKKILGVSTIAAVTPSSWKKPIVNAVILPAHAETSICVDIEITYTGGNESTNLFRDGNNWWFGTNRPYDPSTDPLSNIPKRIEAQYTVAAPYTLSIYERTFLEESNEVVAHDVDVLNSDGSILCTYRILALWG